MLRMVMVNSFMVMVQFMKVSLKMVFATVLVNQYNGMVILMKVNG
jgi:hypothetical protein